MKVNRAFRVLVVDDSGDTVEGLAALLRTLGHQTRVARDGREAMAAARVFHPEVAFLDIALPDVSGFEVARELRTYHPHSYVVALTTQVSGIDRDRASRAGFDLHVGKPIGAQALLMVLEVAQYAERARAPAML